MRILVTGANGFVGRFLCPLLAARGHQVTAALRQLPGAPVDGAKNMIAVGDMDADTDWSEATNNQDAVIHLAARTHILGEKNAEPLFRQINVEATRALAAASLKAGVRRFVYLSSVKAQAERSTATALTETMPPLPEDAYGRTKLAAENLLLESARGTGMRVVALRPPLIYGPGLKANLLTLFRACDRRLPLPLALVNNRRSLVYIGNLSDALIRVSEAPALESGVFLISDGEAISTPELVRRISRALGHAPRLLPAPVWMLRMAGVLTGKADTIDRLTGSLVINDDKLRHAMGWTPPFNMIQGLERTVEWFRDQT